ncbi:MAG TPA: hypothetical protein VLU25_11155 [Acidobacteriota bacterium]|nr:hypothetical protein [Acidobacteriota bacterium]
MKCILCGRRKGKRSCPAKNGLICPQCCGEKRMVEIDCPADCRYLRTGQRHANRKMASQFGRNIAPARLQKYIADLERFAPHIMALEREIVRFARGLRKLEEEVLAEGFKLAKKTLSTESRGVLYQHRSPNPLVEEVARHFLKQLEALRSGEGAEKAGLPRLTLDQAVTCLECLELQVEDYRQSHEAGAYVTFLRRNYPDLASSDQEEDSDNDSPSLIIQP